MFSALLRSGRGASYLLEPQREDYFALIVRTPRAGRIHVRECLAAQDVCLSNAERGGQHRGDG